MSEQGKIGLCLECGSNFHPEKYVNLAEKSIYQFLGHFGLIEQGFEFSSRAQRKYKVIDIAVRQSEQFHFDKEYQNFDELTAGAVFAVDGDKKYVAGSNQAIVFPRPDQKIGQESFTQIERLNS